jgi:FtsP/CotA-like multicopper oxidase with cupredoxin domain
MDPMAKDDRSALGWFAVCMALGALVLGVFGLRDDDSGGAQAAAGGGATVIDVSMADFSFSPSMVEIPTSGATLRLHNDGSVAHNMKIPALGLTSDLVQPGGSAEFRIGPTAAGDYDLLCDQPGHADSGMKGMLMVAEGASGAGGGSAQTPTTMGWEEMDAMMEAVAKQFPAKTEGRGGDRLEPTVLADGTKQFDLEAKIVQWEVAPGKFVEAWTYNGVVPAPEIKVSSGDKIRIVLTNNLPESTSLHLHGIKVPNLMDGVDPYTQAPTEPGQTHTYDFVAEGPAVGIYHSHHNAQVQVPNGLFGAFLIDDIPIPQKLIDKGYTQVDKSVNMVLNDAGTIGLSLNGKSFPATEPTTLKVGEVLLVHYLNEGLMAHPMHMHQPVGWIIAKDGVPLDEPIPGDTINVAPGERYSVLYMPDEPGVWAWHCHILNHAESSTGMFGMVTALIVGR